MKKILLLLPIIILFSSCTNNESKEKKVEGSAYVEINEQVKNRELTQLTRKDKISHYNISSKGVYFDSFMPGLFESWTQKEIPNANEKTFRLVNSYVGINDTEQRSIVYLYGNEQEIEHPKSFTKALEENKSYYSDGVYVYYRLLSNTSKFHKITKILNEEEIIPFSIEKYDHPDYFLRVGDRLFFQGIQITKADIDSFRFVFHDDTLDENLAENNIPWFADKNRVYMWGKEVIVADPESIRIPEQDRNLDARVAIDDNYIYSFYAYKTYRNKCKNRYCLIDLRLNNIKSEGFHIDKDDYIRGSKGDRYITKEGIFDGTGKEIQ